MSLPADQKLISADDHMDIHAMPPDVWEERLPKSWRDRANPAKKPMAKQPVRFTANVP